MREACTELKRVAPGRCLVNGRTDRLVMVPRETFASEVFERVEVRCQLSSAMHVPTPTDLKVDASEGISTIVGCDRVDVGAHLYHIAPEPYLRAIARHCGHIQMLAKTIAVQRKSRVIVRPLGMSSAARRYSEAKLFPSRG